jgi:hypothetical protein
MTVRLRTGRYQTFDPSMGTPVRVTVGRPKFPLDYEIAAEIDELKPLGRIFNLSGEEFEQAFRAHLEGIGVDRIRERFAEVAAEHPEPLVLLCFEDVLAGQACHRRTFAHWWNEQTGEDVPEAEPADPAQMTIDLGGEQ